MRQAEKPRRSVFEDDAIRIIFFDRCPIFSDVKVNFRYLFMWFGFHIFVLPNFKLFLL